MILQNTFYGAKFSFLKTGDAKLKGDGEYQIKFPRMGWSGGEISIEIHCDAGQILTKAGNRAQIGICGFLRNRKGVFSRRMNFANV